MEKKADMKKKLNFFIRKQKALLADCVAFKVEDEQSDLLYGGFKEYKPAIYEQEKIIDNSIRTIDLMANVNQIKE